MLNPVRASTIARPATTAPPPTRVLARKSTSSSRRIDAGHHDRRTRMKLRKNISSLTTPDENRATRSGLAMIDATADGDEEQERPLEPGPAQRDPPVHEQRRAPSEQQECDEDAVRLDLERQVAREHVAPDRDEEDDQDQRGEQPGPADVDRPRERRSERRRRRHVAAIADHRRSARRQPPRESRARRPRAPAGRATASRLLGTTLTVLGRASLRRAGGDGSDSSNSRRRGRRFSSKKASADGREHHGEEDHDRHRLRAAAGRSSPPSAASAVRRPHGPQPEPVGPLLLAQVRVERFRATLSERDRGPRRGRDSDEVDQWQQVAGSRPQSPAWRRSARRSGRRAASAGGRDRSLRARRRER